MLILNIVTFLISISYIILLVKYLVVTRDYHSMLFQLPLIPSLLILFIDMPHLAIIMMCCCSPIMNIRTYYNFLRYPPLYKIGSMFYMKTFNYTNFFAVELRKSTVIKIQYSVYKQVWKYYYTKESEEDVLFNFAYENEMLSHNPALDPNLTYDVQNAIITSSMKRQYNIKRLM